MKSIQVVAVLVVMFVRVSVMAQVGIEGNYSGSLPMFVYVNRNLCHYVEHCGCRIRNGIPKCFGYWNVKEYCPEPHHENKFIKDEKVCDLDGKMYE